MNYQEILKMDPDKCKRKQLLDLINADKENVIDIVSEGVSVYQEYGVETYAEFIHWTFNDSSEEFQKEIAHKLFLLHKFMYANLKEYVACYNNKMISYEND